MAVFQDYLCNDHTEGFYNQTHKQPCFHSSDVYTNPSSPVPPLLFTLNQSPKDIAGSDITNIAESDITSDQGKHLPLATGQQHPHVH